MDWAGCVEVLLSLVTVVLAVVCIAGFSVYLRYLTHAESLSWRLLNVLHGDLAINYQLAMVIIITQNLTTHSTHLPSILYRLR